MEATTQRSFPIAYVVALQQEPEGGEARDVTRRYVGSALGLQKLRDERWWAATLKAHASARRPRCQGSGRGVGDGPAAGTDAAGPIVPSVGHRVAAGSAGPLPAAAPPRAGSDEAAGSGGKAAADVRAKREDDELQLRSASQMLGLPTSLEGFKTHPLYILKRHLTKYQVKEGRGAAARPTTTEWISSRESMPLSSQACPCLPPLHPMLSHTQALQPGAALLGTHKGESYYARALVSDLHTAERWRRVGREVRPGV